MVLFEGIEYPKAKLQRELRKWLRGLGRIHLDRGAHNEGNLEILAQTMQASG